MTDPIRILLRTTIPPIEDDWHIGRFSMLCGYLAGIRGDSRSLCSRPRIVSRRPNDRTAAFGVNGIGSERRILGRDAV